jgi:hypothetical protein
MGSGFLGFGVLGFEIELVEGYREFSKIPPPAKRLRHPLVVNFLFRVPHLEHLSGLLPVLWEGRAIRLSKSKRNPCIFHTGI